MLIGLGLSMNAIYEFFLSLEMKYSNSIKSECGILLSCHSKIQKGPRFFWSKIIDYIRVLIQNIKKYGKNKIGKKRFVHKKRRKPNPPC